MHVGKESPTISKVFMSERYAVNIGERKNAENK